MVAIANITGSNPGPNIDTAPDITQLVIGNVKEVAIVDLVLSPASVANATSAEQTFTLTGVLTGDFVYVNKPTAQAGLGIVGSRVSASNVIGITFGNFTAATITPTSSETYVVYVARGPIPATPNVPQGL